MARIRVTVTGAPGARKLKLGGKFVDAKNNITMGAISTQRRLVFLLPEDEGYTFHERPFALCPNENEPKPCTSEEWTWNKKTNQVDIISDKEFIVRYLRGGVSERLEWFNLRVVDTDGSLIYLDPRIKNGLPDPQPELHFGSKLVIVLIVIVAFAAGFGLDRLLG